MLGKACIQPRGAHPSRCDLEEEASTRAVPDKAATGGLQL